MPRVLRWYRWKLFDHSIHRTDFKTESQSQERRIEEQKSYRKDDKDSQQSLEDVCMDTGENYSIMPSTTHSKMASRSHCWCYQDTFIGCWLVNDHCLLILAGDGGIPIQWCVRTQILSEWPMPPILLHIHMFSHESPPSNLYHKEASNYCTATGRKVGIHWLPSPHPSPPLLEEWPFCSFGWVLWRPQFWPIHFRMVTMSSSLERSNSNRLYCHHAICGIMIKHDKNEPLIPVLYLNHLFLQVYDSETYYWYIQ